MTVSISNLRRVTCVVPDIDLAADYLRKLFRAERLQQVPSHLSAAASLRLGYVGLGDLVIELVEPLLPNSPWQRRLEDEGAHVVSLAYGFDDIDRLIAALSAERLELVEAENNAVWCKCRHLIGFDLILEPWNRNFPRQKPGRWGDVSPMLHVEVTHQDIGEAGRWLEKMFGSQRVERAFSDFLVGITAGRMDIKHFNLGDAVLQYIEPRHDAGPWWDLLQRAGPSVHNITWLVNDMPTIAQASEAAGTKDLRYFEFDYSPLFGKDNRIGDKTVGRIIDCAYILGFHLELSERQARNINEFMFKAV
jgi:hypothetical protein